MFLYKPDGGNTGLAEWRVTADCGPPDTQLGRSGSLYRQVPPLHKVGEVKTKIILKVLSSVNLCTVGLRMRIHVINNFGKTTVIYNVSYSWY